MSELKPIKIIDRYIDGTISRYYCRNCSNTGNIKVNGRWKRCPVCPKGEFHHG